jgi:iron(III) transport system substrate-binding protein
MQNLLEQARKEGEVVLYTTMTVRDFEVFKKAAKEEYPFLNIQHIYLSASRQAARVMQEFRVGKLQADVLGNSLEAMLYYQKQGVIANYESPEAKNMIKGSVDPDAYWAGITTDLLITAFHSRQVPKGSAPINYDDYLNPKFKGQMAINSGTPYALVGMVSFRGEEQGIAYVKRLSQQHLRSVEGFTHEGQQALVKAGKIPLRRGVKSPAKEIDQLLDSEGLHVIKPKGDFSKYQKLYNEFVGVK